MEGRDDKQEALLEGSAQQGWGPATHRHFVVSAAVVTPMPRINTQQRSDPDFAGEVIQSVFARTSQAAMRSYRQFLTASIEYLSQQRPNCWGITLLARGVRLNAGWVECLVLRPDGLRVLVDTKSAPPGTKFDGRRYRWARGCRMTTLPLSDLHRTLPGLANSHLQALAITAKRQSPPNILDAHSSGITKLWSLPDPHGRRIHVVQGGVVNGDKRLLQPIESPSMLP